MAEIQITYTEPAVTGDAKFEELIMNFSSMETWMNVSFNRKHKEGRTSILDGYNSLLAEEKPAALKFVKILVVNNFNAAMGTNYTWNQVSNSIFTKQEEVV